MQTSSREQPPAPTPPPGGKAAAPSGTTPGAAAHSADVREFARRVLAEEIAALEACAAQIGPRFAEAVALLTSCADAGGTVLVTGLGKSGLIGAKISATLASLGIPSHPVHPAEAAHGDLGRIRPTDTVICLSRSGETDEVVNLAAILRQDGLPIISITGGSAASDRPPSSLERLATVALHLGEFEEAGSGFAAPTCSTTATVALGDALALAAARTRNFGDADFARRHPGGALGGLLRPITEVLRFRTDTNCPPISDATSVIQAVGAAHGRRAGAVILVDEAGRLSGILTDADLRRKLTELGQGSWLTEPIARVMTRAPITLPDTSLVRDAVRLTRERRLDEIPIVDAEGRPVGMLDVQDLVAMRLVKDDA